ncbi:hypothetical protein BDF20DRAFT_535290 [Mycotypha africana]|uniref:uncharacterized protein n=1 Tax=Mycotypha africana TaxID=64632 RepID=UPI0023018001|nr:uncharacterized protein BDF20DRAFT_535290 [Mycotypha africana]KAI8979834.1 hypothetical protein BDF20DRAFT_535290 [Mycotypha africana]
MAKTRKATTRGGSSKQLRTVPDMFMKQKAASTRKRTIAEADSEEDVDELESSGSESEDELETNNQPSTAKGRNAKKRKAEGSFDAVVNTNSQLLQPATQEETQDSLYDKALVPEIDIEAMAKSWKRKYESNQYQALKNLFNFILRCSGCSLEVTIEAVQDQQNSVTALNELKDELSKHPPTEYPIISKAKEFKTLRRNLILFFREIINQCQHQAIYDGVLMESLQGWLVIMSSSTYRPFRHTATIIALKLTDQLAILGDKFKDLYNTSLRQLNTENKKKKRETGRLRELKAKVATNERKYKDIEEFIKAFFDDVFIRRSRDVESVIRVECLKELCTWLQSYQAYFVDNVYLRHFGWALNDPSANVRSEALKSITKLYKIENIATRLTGFINRFKTRIEEMALKDIEISVRINAIHLCSALFEANVNILSDNGRKKLLGMISSEIPRVRKSAAPFAKALLEATVIQPLIANVTESLLAHNSGSKSGRRSAATANNASSVNVNKTWITFKALASFLVEHLSNLAAADDDVNQMQTDLGTLSSSLIEKRTRLISNIVEALWDQLSELQDFQALTDYLLRDHSISHQQEQRDEEEMDLGEPISDCYRLEENQETMLIIVFASVLRTAMTKGLDKNLSETKDRKKLDNRFWEENTNELSRHMVRSLPKLLSKHLDDSSKIVDLVALPSLMNMNVYLELQAERDYEILLQIFSRIFLGAITKDLLANCASSLQYMSKNTNLSTYNDANIGDLKEAVIKQFEQTCNGRDLATVNFTPALTHSLSICLHRLAYLINFLDATTSMDDNQNMAMSVTDYVGALVDRAAYGSDDEKPDISLTAMTILSRYLMWKCRNLQDALAVTDIIPIIERRRDWVLDKFVEIIKGVDGTSAPEVRIAVLGHLIDLYWLFGSDMLDAHDASRLKVRCSDELQTTFVELLKTQLTVAKEFPDEKPSKQSNLSQKDLLYQLVTSFARGLLMGVINIEYSILLFEQFNKVDTEVDDIIKALTSEVQTDMVSDEAATDGFCRAYLEALKMSFNEKVSHSIRSIESTLRLARLFASSLNGGGASNNESANTVHPQIICERIHLEGINFALTKAAEAYEQNKDDERDNALKFFKILTVFAKDLQRARDVARIHGFLDDTLKQHEISVDESAKEWEHFAAYVQTIDQVLRKKGLKYGKFLSSTRNKIKRVSSNTNIYGICRPL